MPSLLLLALAAAQAGAAPQPCAPGRVCELPLALSPAAAEAVLGTRSEAWWVNGDRITVVARREGEAQLCCAINRPLHPIGRGLQAISLRIPDIDSAIVDIAVIPLVRQELGPSWRGPAAPPAPERSAESSVPLRIHDLDSVHLGARRRIIVYVPPGLAEGRRVPVIYLADGMWPSFPQIADAFARHGRSSPVVIVGIANAPRTAPPACPETRCDTRNQELLADIPGATPDQARFDARARFTVEEVLPFVESHYPVLAAREGRAVMGHSSGGAWAVTMAARYPQVFGNVIGLSVGWAPAAHAAADLHHARVLLAAGRLESDRFRDATAEAAARARGAGAEVRLLNLNAGHDFGQWEIAFAEALVWMFPPAR